MIGDGVNDVFVFCVVDIGIVIGGGSDIVIEVVDMVFFEFFFSVVEVVCFGWVLFDNFKKIIVYFFFVGSFVEFWFIMINVVFGLL